MNTVTIQTKPCAGNPTGHVIINATDYDPKIHKLVGAAAPNEGEEEEEPAEGSAEYFADTTLFKNKGALTAFLDAHKAPYETDANRAALEAACVEAFAKAKE